MSPFIILNLSGLILNTILKIPQMELKSECTLLLGFCLFVGNLNSSKDFDEIKTSLRKFFSKNSLEIVDVRLGGSK